MPIVSVATMIGLQGHLSVTNWSRPMETPSGLVKTRAGNTRLQVPSFVANLIEVKEMECMSEAI
jgi:hypothetical protein